LSWDWMTRVGVTGIELGPETEQKYINEIKMATYPQLIPHSYIHEIEGKIILVFEINEYPVKPVAYKTGITSG